MKYGTTIRIDGDVLESREWSDDYETNQPSEDEHAQGFLQVIAYLRFRFMLHT